MLLFTWAQQKVVSEIVRKALMFTESFRDHRFAMHFMKLQEMLAHVLSNNL